LVGKVFMVSGQLGAAALEDAPAEVLGGAGEEVLHRRAEVTENTGNRKS
jgi:hypothetical protein